MATQKFMEHISSKKVRLPVPKNFVEEPFVQCFRNFLWGGFRNFPSKIFRKKNFSGESFQVSKNKTGGKHDISSSFVSQCRKIS